MTFLFFCWVFSVSFTERRTFSAIFSHDPARSSAFSPTEETSSCAPTFPDSDHAAKTGAIYNAKAIIVTTGTYLKGKVIIGDVSYESGPDGVFPANKLSDSLKKLGIELRRFKTGTPARMNIKDLNLSKMEPQYGDNEVKSFSFDNEDDTNILNREQIKCYLTYTNKDELYDVVKIDAVEKRNSNDTRTSCKRNY